MQNNTAAFSLLDSSGAVHIKDVVPKDLCHFLTHTLLRSASTPESKKGDNQVPSSLVVVDHETVVETLLESLWPKFESLLGMELLPTYAYSRLYSNNDILEKHRDRPACEISATVQLGRSHHYAWPIYMGGQRYDLAEGDAVIYRGCDIDHWRDACDGPPGYYSGQVFLHFVKADGQYSNQAGDSGVRNVWPNMFVKHRAYLMEGK